MNKGMYKTKCAVCEKEMYVYAKDRSGNLPTVYCSKVCETNAKYERRFDKRFK